MTIEHIIVDLFILLINRHAKVCTKVFASKRKVFDSAKHRAQGTELESFQKHNKRNTNTNSRLNSNSFRTSTPNNINNAANRT